MRRTVKFKVALSDRGAIKFDSGGAAVIRLETDEQQMADVAMLLAGSGKVIDATFTFDDTLDTDDDGG